MKKFKKPIMLRTHFKKLVKDLNDNFKGIGADIDNVYEQIDELNQLKKEFHELREEIATNGVVRDLRKLEKDFHELRKHTANLIMDHDRQLEDLKHNGVATSINRLNTEVFGEKIDSESALSRAMYRIADIEPAQKVTLRGKLDAVIKHLGLDISVKPRQVEESKVVAKKVKQTKKGKK